MSTLSHTPIFDTLPEKCTFAEALRRHKQKVKRASHAATRELRTSRAAALARLSPASSARTSAQASAGGRSAAAASSRTSGARRPPAAMSGARPGAPASERSGAPASSASSAAQWPGAAGPRVRVASSGCHQAQGSGQAHLVPAGRRSRTQRHLMQAVDGLCSGAACHRARGATPAARSARWLGPAGSRRPREQPRRHALVGRARAARLAPHTAAPARRRARARARSPGVPPRPAAPRRRPAPRRRSAWRCRPPRPRPAAPPAPPHQCPRPPPRPRPTCAQGGPPPRSPARRATNCATSWTHARAPEPDPASETSNRTPGPPLPRVCRVESRLRR